MKHNAAVNSGRMLLAVLLSAGCGNETSGPASATRFASHENVSLSAREDRCELVLNKGQDDYRESFRYNSNGLVEVYNDQFGGTTTMAYDIARRLVSARYTADASAYDLTFEYAGGKIVKEIVFDGTTGAVVDTLVNTYNTKGQMVRRESFGADFYATFAYDARGNAYQVDVLGTDGYLYISNTYSFTKEVKNPHLALRGLPYGIPYINDVYNPWRQTAAKAVITGEDGNPVTLFDQDPERSTLLAGPQNYATYQRFYDKLSATYYSQVWRYEKCRSGTPGQSVTTESSLTQSATGHGVSRRSALRLHGSKQDLKEQIAALRQAYGK